MEAMTPEEAARTAASGEADPVAFEREAFARYTTAREAHEKSPTPGSQAALDAASKAWEAAKVRLEDAGTVQSEALAAHWLTVAERGRRGQRGPWLTTIPPAREWLLEVPASMAANGKRRGLFPRGKVGMLAAGGGVGKTMALSQLAVAVATGRPWLGGDKAEGFITPEEGGRVLLVLAEEDEAEVHRRLYNAAEWMDLTPAERQTAAERIVLLPMAGEPVALVTASDKLRGEATESPLAEQFESRLSTGGPWSLVIMDPLARFAGGDTEKDNAAATRFIQVIERFVRAPGKPSVIVAHHTSQTARQSVGAMDGTGVRGVTGLVDAIRWCAEMRNMAHPKGSTVPRMAEFTVSKSNYSATSDAPLWLVKGDFGELRAATPDQVKAWKKATAEAEATAKAEEAKAKKDAAAEAEKAGGRGADKKASSADAPEPDEN